MLDSTHRTVVLYGVQYLQSDAKYQHVGVQIGASPMFFLFAFCFTLIKISIFNPMKHDTMEK